MPPRSHVHMLSVAAERLAADHADPKLVADIRTAAKAAAKKLARGEGWSPEEDARVERQRTLFAMLPDTRATEHLKEAMLQRAYDLMWDGNPIACDALVEFLPSKDVEAMFDAWMQDQDPGERSRSRWYERA